MTSSLFGLPVARAIPDHALLGLATGQYTLHGGVIRWAAGTPQAGPCRSRTREEAEGAERLCQR